MTKKVAMISTYHSNETQTVTERGKEKTKPVCVFDYNQHMGGTNLKDKLLQPYLLERKRSSKWYVKLPVKGLFAKYGDVTEPKIPGRHSTNNTVLRLTERHFI
jgi:hypothetical protein